MIINPRYWEFRQSFLDAADPLFYTGEYLDSIVALGKADIWFSEHASIVAEIRDYPGGARVIEGIVAAGPLDEILDLIAEAEVYGKSIGCTHAIIESREGWGKVLKDKGYTLWQQSVRKVL